MSDPNLTPQEKLAVNHAMQSAFTEWCDYGDQADYVDLARRLNVAAVHAAIRLRNPENRRA